jgi:hypothetical protein
MEIEKLKQLCVPVSERLPIEKEAVICIYTYDDLDIEKEFKAELYLKDNEWYIQEGEFFDERAEGINVTHWLDINLLTTKKAAIELASLTWDEVANRRHEDLRSIPPFRNANKENFITQNQERL